MISKLFARVFIFTILYLLVCALIYAISYFSLSQKTFINLPAFKAVQKNLYYYGQFGFIDIWQNKTECVSYDEELIYVPKIGSCRYKNAEFDTILNFEENGRLMPEIINNNANPIIVIGDSHAMGWGVNDDETFSYILQNILKRQVYNLAVSSYGTVREIIRLNKTNLLSNSNILIIQYHENDINENRDFQKIKKKEYENKFLQLKEQKSVNILTRMGFILKTYKSSLRLVFSDITGLFVKTKHELDFTGHYPILIELLKNIEDFEKKRIIIFFSNGVESRFYNFPEGIDKNYKNIYFANIKLNKDDHFYLDQHPNRFGHKKIAESLAKVLTQFEIY